MIKAIALDIDGTITDQSRKLDETCIEPIRKAEKAGISISLATGNVLCFARTASVLLGTSGPLIVENGGIVFNEKNREEHVIGDKEKVDKGVKVLKDEFDNIRNKPTLGERKTDRTLERTIKAKEASEIMQKHGLKVKAVDSGFAIHIEDLNVNKGEALKKVASIIGCSLSDIAAIGDAENDVEMLEKAGVSYTPANASSEAKNSSTKVMNGSYGKGVKEAISLILENVKN